MPYINSALVTEAIRSIFNIKFIGTPYKNEKDLLAYFLFLSKIKMNKFNTKTLNKIFEDRENIYKTLYELAGVFSPNEHVEKKVVCFLQLFFIVQIIL